MSVITPQVLLQRLKEAEQFKQWESQEDQVCTVYTCIVYIVQVAVIVNSICDVICRYTYNVVELHANVHDNYV